MPISYPLVYKPPFNREVYLRETKNLKKFYRNHKVDLGWCRLRISWLNTDQSYVNWILYLLGGMDKISEHTFQLAKLAHDTLQSLMHHNSSRVVKLYCDTEFKDRRLQGAILSFNLLRSNGDYIGYNEVRADWLCLLCMIYNTFLQRKIVCTYVPIDLSYHFTTHCTSSATSCSVAQLIILNIWWSFNQKTIEVVLFRSSF